MAAAPTLPVVPEARMASYWIRLSFAAPNSADTPSSDSGPMATSDQRADSRTLRSAFSSASGKSLTVSVVFGRMWTKALAVEPRTRESGSCKHRIKAGAADRHSYPRS